MSSICSHEKCITAIQPCKRKILRAIRHSDNVPWTVLSNGYTTSENAHVLLIMWNESRKKKMKQATNKT